MPQPVLAAPSRSTQPSVFVWVFPQGFFLDVKCQRQPPNELFKVRNALGRLAGVFIRGGKQRGFRIFNKLLLPLRELIFAEVVSTT